jgi:hypothetical protein
MDLRDLLRADLRVHPRLVQQGLFGRVDARQRIAAAIPPLIPFADAQYAGGIWIIDWDHRIPSRHAVLRLYAYYTPERQRELEAAHAARTREISGEDLFPEFDVSDYAALPADEAYEAETDLAGSPSRLRLVSEWRRRSSRTRRHAPSTSCARRRRFASYAGRVASAPPGLATWSPQNGLRRARAGTCAGRWTSGTC